KQRTWSMGPVPRRFPFSKLVSEGLNREISFENTYRESKSRGISWMRHKCLAILDYHRLRRPVPANDSSPAFARPFPIIRLTPWHARRLSFESVLCNSLCRDPVYWGYGNDSPQNGPLQLRSRE